MSAAELIRLVTNAIFIAVFVVVVRSALRERTRASFDTALLFGAIAVVIASSQLTALLGTRPAAVSAGAALLLLALPYLQLRLVDDFAGPRVVIIRACLGGLALAIAVAVLAVAGLVDLTPALPLLGALGVLYFFGFGAYAAAVFAREARRTPGIGSRRLGAAACGSLALSATLLAATILRGVEPALSTSVTMVLGLISAIGYFVAFAPPALLRRAWREPVLRAFVSDAAAISPLDDPADIIGLLEAGAARVTAATSAQITLIGETSDPARLEAEGTHADPVLWQVFRTQRPQLRVQDGRALLVAPITGRGRQVGVLAVHGRRAPLFAADDLDLVQLLGDQAAIVLDGARLYHDLRSANRELSEATRVKSEFLANMSHELRTPLNAILGFSGLLTEQIGPSMTDRHQRFMRNIKEAGEHLLELINDVLDLSKIEAGKLELRPEIITPDALLEPVYATARATASSKGVEFTFEVEAVDSLLLDPVRVRQVLFNLLSNALKFTPSGGRVKLRAALVGSALEFDVADTGIGIPADARERVFGMFERFHESRNEASGTGLGLALTKRLIEQMGGTIGFESEEGRGTTFRVHLPDVRTEPVTGLRLLVVEDERHDADLIVAVASSVDLRAEVVRSLAGARQALGRGRPLGIVLDLRLPDGRGEDLLAELKRSTVQRDIPVIVVTVEAEPKTILAMGADDYLTKPIDRARLERWLRRVRRSGEPAPARTPRREHARSHR